MSRRTLEILVLHLKKYLWASGITWSAIVFLLYLYTIGETRKTTVELAGKEATSHFNKDTALRLRAASHGGVYVAVTGETLPNPYLTDNPERDVTTPSGRRLTLMNPAYRLRTLMNLTSQKKEIVRLASSFAALWLLGTAGIAFFGTRFRRKIEERQEVEEKYVSVVENSLTGIYIAQAGRIVFANDRFADTYGYSREEVIGMNSLQFVHPEDRDMVGESGKKLKDGEIPEESEVRELTKDGEIIWVRRRHQGIRYCGEPAVLGSVLDVTSLKKAEASLNAYVEKLEQKNEELEVFASIVSHDLQEPLRKIRAFASRIGNMKGDSLCEKGRDYLVRMQLSAERMQELIMGLLEYSRVTSRAAPFTRVDLKHPVAEVVTELSMLVEESGGRVEVGDLPAIEADPVQMRQLFQNLICNALKYRSEQRPFIRIFSETQSDEFIDILVEDNGIGFEEKYLDKIFMPFQRLHGVSSSYPGTGMGLAICRKIVERHGGTITAKSAPGQGSTFVVTLPKK